MKYLVMCEGPNELEIIRMLLEHDKLVFSEDDLLKPGSLSCKADWKSPERIKAKSRALKNIVQNRNWRCC